jgi:hypothetical protein
MTKQILDDEQMLDSGANLGLGAIGFNVVDPSSSK